MTHLSTQLKIFTFKLLGVIGSATIFGLISSPLIHFSWIFSAFLLAFGFGFFFLGGAGYRILIAVALNDPTRHTATSWSGAVALSALAAIGVWCGFLIAGQAKANLLLAAYAIAINIAYLFVKLACLQAGCCRAKQNLHRQVWPWFEPDLRMLEIVLTGSILLLSLWLLFFWQNPQFAAITGLGGHLVVRLFSRWARKRLPRNILGIGASGLELIPLAIATLVAVFTP